MPHVEDASRHPIEAVPVELHRLLLAAPFKLPPKALRALIGKPLEVDGLVLDPQCQLVVRAMDAGRMHRYQGRSVANVRSEFDASAVAADDPGPPLPRVVDRSIPGPNGPIRVRILYPRVDAGALPAVVHYHGGGFCLGSLASSEAICHRIARAIGCAVVNVDYRLAPEHRFPAGVEDAFAAFRWTHANAAELGLDPNRLAVWGDSAGGCLATVVSLLSRDSGGPMPCFQMLVYPVTNSRVTTRSRELFAKGFFLDQEKLDWFTESYLALGDERDFRASPLRRPDLSGLPPAYVVTAGFDPLRDEGRAYARRLAQANVPVEDVLEEGLIHGFASMGFLDEGRRAFDRACSALARVFRS